MPAAIRFHAVHKHYARLNVLQGIDLEIPAGEFCGLVGVNGAGKTTLIKGLLDLCAIDGGRIEIFGTTHRQTAARAQLAYLPERFLPPHYTTGRDFLEFMRTLHAATYDTVLQETVLAALDFDAGALAKPVRALSKGMAQKLGLAATLLSGKPLFVLDEPMSGLDPKARALLKQYLLGLRGRQQTLFFSTHLLSDVEVLCDRIAILHGGRLRFVGSPSECCAQFAVPDLEQAYLYCVA
jgi:ABC-2 type transport system ATP-binding protein